MSTTLFGWMRSCFQNGMGAKPFSDALRIQHLQKYDEIELQYLDVLAGFKLDGWAGQTYKAFLPFDDHSPDGPFGFVPSGSWVREMYDRFIEEHHNEFNQHMALLTAEIIALDHSHKLTKQIYKVNGKEVFTALLTVTNEKGEIRSCNLVATKSHKQFELALHAILKSLHLYGHLPPGLAFTDNIQGDRQFLEESFPSLREGVVPVEKIVIGFDSEWNVEISGNGHIFHRGKTAIIQIAYDNRVYILQIGDMLAGGKLPRQLEILLSHPRILKAGRLVKADLQYLQDACQSRDPFVGALDLAKYAKDRHVISSARCGLADLSAIILKKRLSKNVPECVSTAWDSEELTHNQLEYAACDAWACLKIYEKLSCIDLPQPLSSKPVPSTSVLLYSSDNTKVIAHGLISSYTGDEIFDHINITQTQTVIDVIDVLVPGAIITTHHKQALEAFGKPPFSVVCLRSHVRVFPWQALPAEDLSSKDCQPSQGVSTTAEDLLPGDEALFDSEALSLGDIILDNSSTSHLPDPPSDYPHEVDEGSVAQADALLPQPPIAWDNTLRSRVLKDVFHVFNML
ncbi:hypothetical protein CPB84DRAFT_1754505 [Gymnopilus junonius]|uniref:3'-5' exonuclease n=1 Tax=Gymnopilus junonius TaxID=109634 RepID=A0A9P5N9M1_GYMJU|nr:hypothetical protein CPB84DRAFT_1754505 [Gymnopilus junonius]